MEMRTIQEQNYLSTVNSLQSWRTSPKLAKRSFMITAFIIADSDVQTLTRTLNALIGATVEGLLREVIVITECENDEVAKLADHVGCALIAQTEFSTALQAAKGDWVLLLEGGALPEQGWVEAVGNHIQMDGGAARFTRSPLAQRHMVQRLFQRETRLVLGLLIKKRTAVAFGKSALTTPEALAKAANPKPLAAQLRPALNVHRGAA